MPSSRKNHGVGAAPAAQIGDGKIVDRLVEARGQRRCHLELLQSRLEPALHQLLRPQIVVVVRHRGQIVDGLEVTVGLRRVRQKVEGRELTVDVHTGHDVSAADHDSVAVAPSLVVLNLDVERIETVFARNSHEEIDEGEAVAFPRLEGLDGASRWDQRILEVEPPEDEVADGLGTALLAPGGIDPIGHLGPHRLVDAVGDGQFTLPVPPGTRSLARDPRCRRLRRRAGMSHSRRPGPQSPSKRDGEPNVGPTLTLRFRRIPTKGAE